jgi:hypothetical protein
MNKFKVKGGVENEKRLFWTSVYRMYESITRKDLKLDNKVGKSLNSFFFPHFFCMWI